MNRRRDSKNNGRRRGSSLLPVLIFTAVLAVLARLALAFIATSVDEGDQQRAEIQALYLAEAGISAGMSQLAASHKTGAAVAANVGTMDTPLELRAGGFWTTITENVDGSMTLSSTGTARRASRTIEAIAQPVPPDPFEHSMFAGNLSGDPAYQLELGGTGGQADEVNGNVYSGGDIVVSGDASVSGDLKAAGTITGAPGEGNRSVNVPQLLEIDYELFNDYDVAALFAGAPQLSDDAGGTAGQLPATSPAHFFRLNPSDRASDVNSTVKDDYFLEDPYEAISPDDPQDGSEAFDVTIPEEANNSVFYIDGNLWLHNRTTFSLKIKNTGLDPTRVTFVVRGNVYFSDNLYYGDPDLDGVAFIALADESVEDSGNIYFGDPLFGTMQYAEALMFAENDFIDNNLDAAGSSKVTIRGNMTAGNQVAIERDYDNGDGTFAHTKLSLTYDSRQSLGTLNLPGIPRERDHAVGYTVATWREVPTPKQFELPAPTIQVDSPALDLPIEDPFYEPEPVVDPEAPEPEEPAPQSKNWRNRWEKKFAKSWKTKKRRHKWSKKN